jgi:hypothetical protein
MYTESWSLETRVLLEGILKNKMHVFHQVVPYRCRYHRCSLCFFRSFASHPRLVRASTKLNTPTHHHTLLQPHHLSYSDTSNYYY